MVAIVERRVRGGQAGAIVRLGPDHSRLVPKRITFQNAHTNVRLFPNYANAVDFGEENSIRIHHHALPVSHGPFQVVVDNAVLDNPGVTLRHVVLFNQDDKQLVEHEAEVPALKNPSASWVNEMRVERPVRVNFQMFPHTTSTADGIISLPTYAGVALGTVLAGTCCVALTVGLVLARNWRKQKQLSKQEPVVLTENAMADLMLVASMDGGATPAYWANTGNAQMIP